MSSTTIFITFLFALPSVGPPRCEKIQENFEKIPGLGFVNQYLDGMQ